MYLYAKFTYEYRDDRLGKSFGYFCKQNKKQYKFCREINFLHFKTKYYTFWRIFLVDRLDIFHLKCFLLYLFRQDL